MRKLSWLAGIGWFACWCLFAACQPVLGQDGKKDQADTTELHLLDKDEGATFGDWNVWRYDDGDRAVFLVNTKTGYAMHLAWMSNGWISYRTDKGDWYLLKSKGEPEKQDWKGLKVEKFLKMKTSVALDTGKYSFQGSIVENGKKTTQQWNVKVTKGYIDFHNPQTDDRITIRRNSGEIVHNGRSIGAKE
jgi:hypothetical protein